jgi:Ribosomal protein L11 methyltransferase (PrmA)
MTAGRMYSLKGYGEMLADWVRVEAYAQALRHLVRPGSVVADIGTGTGIFAVLACQLGASRVFAIESGPIIQVAREVAAANRCADKIEFHEALSTNVVLPARADVIISDLRGVLPLYEQHIPAIADARRRLLAPSGAMISRSDAIWVAVVEAPEAYSEFVAPWEGNPLNQDLGPARRRAVNITRKINAEAEQLLTKPKLWATLDYMAVEDPDVHGDVHCVAERGGIAHGMLVWFDADLAEGVGFSNAPGAPKTIYGSLFFPWTRPVPLVSGQAVCLSLEAKLVEGDYVWRWSAHIEPANGSDNPIRFEQSLLQGAVLSVAALRKQASDHVPHLSAEGRIHRRALELMDGQTSLEEIARRLAAEFPERFARWQQALSYVGTISQTDCC